MHGDGGEEGRKGQHALECPGMSIGCRPWPQTLECPGIMPLAAGPGIMPLAAGPGIMPLAAGPGILASPRSGDAAAVRAMQDQLNKAVSDVK